MKFKVFFLLIVTLVSCKQNSNETKQLPENYNKNIEAYKADLDLSRKNGYLQLTGLFKLDSLQNTFGKDSINDFVLNIDALPNTIGQVSILKEGIYFEAKNDVKVVTTLDSVITLTKLHLDEYGSSEKLYHEQLNWQVITRSNSLYLRVWDTKNPAIKAFKGFKSFVINPNLIFDADFKYFEKEKTESVNSQLGVNANTNFIGQVTFNYNNKDYTLDVGSGGFTMVGDETSGDLTYGGGRYIYLDLPKTNGKVTLDFNYLYNPPCAFSKYTTCLYPPAQNRLPIKILAGEQIAKK
ncbi:DUF1684 domain-containing protein [Pontimicrobium sp. IMCC45349]|uniref:DUF1684 domain-containing protein n=1 Tax=Pontimicrobium sp. IMCC45349 TaxID=3391574 RepID=UPI0039A0645E